MWRAINNTSLECQARVEGKPSSEGGICSKAGYVSTKKLASQMCTRGGRNLALREPERPTSTGRTASDSSHILLLKSFSQDVREDDFEFLESI